MNLLLIVVILLVLLFLVALGFSIKTWRWFDIVSALFVFGAALTLVGYAGLSLKTRSTWQRIAMGLEKQLKQTTKESDKLRYGDPEQPNADPLLNLRGAQHEVNRLLINRGRIWRQGTMAGIDANAGTLKISTQPPPPSEPSPNRLEVKTVVYLYREGVPQQILAPNVQAGNLSVPGFYVGEFKTTEVTENDVTLTPTRPLDAQQGGLINPGPDFRWTIYEKLPTDTPDGFLGLTEEQLRQLMPNNLQIEPARYEALIRSYVREGQDAQPDDPAARRWVEVEFLVDTEEVSVDSTTAQSDRDSKYFDDQGGALSPYLRRGQKVKFTKQQKAILPSARADELIAQEVCRKVRDVYRRELRDYGNDFREITVRMAYLRDRIGEVQRQTAVLVEAQKKAQLQIDYRTQEKLKLEQDLAKVSAERDVVTKYVENLTAAVQDAQQRANELFRQNIAMADELAAVQKRLADEINSRTIEARKGDTTSVRPLVAPATASLSDP